MEHATGALLKMHNAGIPIVIGIDSANRPLFLNFFYGSSNIREIEIMGEAGMAPMDVIVAATKTPSEITMDDQRGGSPCPPVMDARIVFESLFRDYDSILRKDPEMADAFRNLIRERRESSAPFWHQSRKAGLVRQIGMREAEAISHDFWLIRNHGSSCAATIGITDSKVIASRGIIQTLLPIRFLLTRKGNQILDRALEPYFRRGFPDSQSGAVGPERSSKNPER